MHNSPVYYADPEKSINWNQKSINWKFDNLHVVETVRK